MGLVDMFPFRWGSDGSSGARASHAGNAEGAQMVIVTSRSPGFELTASFGPTAR